MYCHFFGGCTMGNHRGLLCAFVLIVLTLVSSTVLWADVTGSILGLVKDRSGAVVSGAHVVVTNVQTNLRQEATSAPDGSYRFLALPVGSYKLTATSSGFAPFNATNIELEVNDQLRFDITLQVGSVQEEVSVSASSVQVEAESTQLGDVIDSKKMLSLLLNGGDVSEGRNLGAGLIPNLDSIEEFRLITNSFDAEYGKFSGSVMNAITKSGTNSFHGDVFEFLRNDKFDAKNYFFGGKSELRRNQFGYVLGGPV